MKMQSKKVKNKRPTLLILTDLSNGDESEDILIGNYLRKYFKVVLCHPDDCEKIEDDVDLVIIRNIWNENKYPLPYSKHIKRLLKKHIPIHDDIFRPDGEDKTYLCELWENGYPVIPTVDSVGDLGKLPETGAYFIRPKDGFDAIGARKISRRKLLQLRPHNHIIQPFVDFKYEISFYYLDERLQYVLYAPDRKREDGILKKLSPAGPISLSPRSSSSGTNSVMA